MLYLMLFWNITGIIVWMLGMCNDPKIRYTELFEFLSPFWIYHNYEVNFFGTAVVCIIYNLICPMASVCYWFYKLCTVGRK